MWCAIHKITYRSVTDIDHYSRNNSISYLDAAGHRRSVFIVFFSMRMLRKNGISFIHGSRVCIRSFVSKSGKVRCLPGARKILMSESIRRKKSCRPCASRKWGMKRSFCSVFFRWLRRTGLEVSGYFLLRL